METKKIAYTFTPDEIRLVRSALALLERHELQRARRTKTEQAEIHGQRATEAKALFDALPAPSLFEPEEGANNCGGGD